MKKINFLVITLLLCVSCNSFNEVGKTLRNEKEITTDEFLVKQKEPLVLPPDSQKLPRPNEIKQENKNEKEKKNIKNILKMENQGNISASTNSSVEDKIIERINK